MKKALLGVMLAAVLAGCGTYGTEPSRKRPEAVRKDGECEERSGFTLSSGRGPSGECLYYPL